MTHEIPDDLVVDPEILVNEQISQPGDPPPRHLWMLGAELFWHVLDGLADDLEIAHHCIDCPRVLAERVNVNPAV